MTHLINCISRQNIKDPHFNVSHKILFYYFLYVLVSTASVKWMNFNDQILDIYSSCVATFMGEI